MDIHKQKDELILIVDDEPQMQRMLTSALEENGFSSISATDGEEALRILDNQNVSVVISDIAMGGMNGIELTEKIKATCCADVILMTGYTKDFSYEKVIEKGAGDFIQKPFVINELIIRLNRVLREKRLHAELKNRLDQLSTVLDGVIHTLSLSIEARDPYTAGHQRRVAELAGAIAVHMGLPEKRIAGIRMAGEIHDLGKIAVPAEILSKPNKLSELEFNLIKIHPGVGQNILKEIKFPWPIAKIIYQHHERMDGSGYPNGLKGDEILIEARIMAVADVVEAIASHRPYRPALGIDAAALEIKKNKGVYYDSNVVDACLDLITNANFKFEA